MKKKINWGNVGWGVCFALNVISAVVCGSVGNIEAMVGWTFASVFLLAARLTEADCDRWRKWSDQWYASSQKWFYRSLELAEEIKKLKKQLEMKNETR